MNKCIVCFEDIKQSWDINGIFKKDTTICERCLQLVRKQDVKRCNHCYKPLAENEVECLDCKFLKQFFDDFHKIYYVTDYHEEMKALIHQFKSDGDIALSAYFAQCLLNAYPKSFFKKYDHIIPVPSSIERQKARGFAHVENILSSANIDYSNVLVANHRKKQSSLTKKERVLQQNPYTMHPLWDKEIKEGMHLLLFDDIYTTGLTAHHAQKVLLHKKKVIIDMLAFARV